MRDKKGIIHIQALDALDIPHSESMIDACMDIDDEFPLHYSNGIVQLYDDGNEFSEWLKTIGFKFEEDKLFTHLAVWGT